MKKFKAVFCCLLTVILIFGMRGTGAVTYALEGGRNSVSDGDAEAEVMTAEARGALQELLEEQTVMALVYLSDEFPIRQEASYDSSAVVTVASGQLVEILDVVVDENHEVWEYVSLYYNEGEYYGYVPRTNLACSDEKFMEWEAEYGMNPALYMPMMLDADGQQAYPDVEAFPESYRPALLALKQAHPQWTFVKMNTGLDWNTVIANELQGGKSLVPNSYAAYMKEGVYGAGWSYASEDVLKLYMDPRNALNENTVFQFEQLTYNPTYHTASAVQGFLNNTFMAGNGPVTGKAYSQIFWETGSRLGVSPFHLASRVYQEQGQGKSQLISGTYSGFEGLYNYFNVKASGKTEQEIYVNGLTHARKMGWTSEELSIQGGAETISKNYILKGQDTLYLQKYNVNPSSPYGLYNHQYMQNIVAPTSEGKSIYSLYNKAGSLNNTFVFKIPVYENMPATPCPMPTYSNNVILTPPVGYTDNKVYLDGIAYPVTARNGKYVVAAPDGNAKTAVMYRYNESGVAVGMYVWTLSYSGGAYTATEQPELRDLLTYHGFSIRITGKAGIRFKTGISADLRGALTSSGVNGYSLKEYGTLVMNSANSAQYPFVKGGAKVLSGRSYGRNDSGGLEDFIYETVDGRHRFTSVLVGLPPTQYKIEYAFRGYITLSRDGQDITIYGPSVARSIYSLAQQVLSSGRYPQGSEAEVFLRQLVADADSVG